MNYDRTTCDANVAEFVIESYVAGSLSESDTETFEEHLLVCDRCQRALVLAVSVWKAFAEIPEADREIGTRITGRPTSTWWTSAWTRHRLATAATVLFSLVAGWWIWASLAGTSSDPQRLAVMPFINLTADSANDYVLAGLNEDIRNEAKQVGALTVMGWQTAQAIAESDDRISDVAREIDVDLFLEASVAQMGDSLRLSIELLDGADERAVWSGDYHVPIHSASTLSLLPKTILLNLAEQGVIQLTAAERRRLAIVGDVSPEAKRLYGEGLYLLRLGDPAVVERGVGLLEQAIDLDASFARAQSLLATGYITAIYTIGLDPRDGYPAAKRAARDAIDFDPELAEAHSALGWTLFTYDLDWEAALPAVERGFELDPENELAGFYYSFVLALMGRDDEAVRVAEYAVGVDPLNVPLVTNVGTIHLLAGRYDEAIAQYNRAQRMQPDFFFAAQWLPLAYSELGLHDEAQAAAQSAVEMNPGMRALLAYVLARAGQTGEATRLAGDLWDEVERGDYLSPAGLAAVYGALGGYDRAFELLDKAVEIRDGSLITILTSPEFDSLRSDERFDDLLVRLNLSRQ